MRGGHQVIGGGWRDRELAEGHDLEAAHQIDGVIGHQAVLGETDRDRAIGHDAIGIGLARIAIETGRQIDGENERVLFAAEAIDLLCGCPNRLAQQMFRAESQHAIENDQSGGTCFCTSLDERKLVRPEGLAAGESQLARSFSHAR